MTDINQVIEKVYFEMIGIVVDGFEEFEIEDAKKEYFRILNNRCSNLNKNINISDYNLLYEKMLKLEMKEWGELAPGVRKHLLLKDKALEGIISIASSAYNYAKERLNESKLIPVELAEENINNMLLLKNNVKEYNIHLAEWHISEGTMDLKYSSGQTDNMSLRIGHIK